VTLLRSEADGRAPDPRAVFTGFGGLLTAVAQDAPVLVAIDDVQWLDGSSQRALEFMARRLVDQPVGGLAAARPNPGHSRLEGTESVHLGPLSLGALHQLIKARAALTLTRPTLLRVHRTTGGNPFYALELVAALVNAGLPGASEPWPVPDDVRAIVTDPLGRLPARVRSALLAAACSARSTIVELDSWALGPAEAAGIVTIDRHGRVRFAHPLFAAAISKTATPAERRRVHARGRRGSRHRGARASSVAGLRRQRRGGRRAARPGGGPGARSRRSG
jgi:hypothetical protein